MQKKWKKATTILGTILLTGVLAFSTSLVAVSCSNNVSTGPTPPTQEESAINRPARGFYYQYDKPNDELYMKQMIQYIYNNNPIKNKYLELGHSWPKITNIESRGANAPSPAIPGEVFARDYDDPVELYKSSDRSWTFNIHFEITDPATQSKEPVLIVYIKDWLFSFTSQKYIDNEGLWSTESDAQTWIQCGASIGQNTWNAPLKIGEYALIGVFDLYSSYSNAVDTWYIINQWESSWPKTREQYWDEMINRHSSRIKWEWALPIK